MKYYIFGIQRTCTNYCKLLIENNFYCENGNVNDYGHWSWKHNGDAEQATANLLQNTPVFFCYKPPIPWLNSLIHQDVDFINRYGLANYPNWIDPDLVLTNKLFSWSLPKAIHVWIDFHLNWLRYMHRCNAVLIHQVKMMEQPHVISVLSKTQYELELVKKHAQWATIDNLVDHGGIITKNKVVTRNNKLTDKQENYVKNNIPKDITSFFERQ